MKRAWKIVNTRSFYSSIWFLMRNNTTYDGTSLYHNKKSDFLYSQSSSRRLAFRPLIQLCRFFNFTICCNHKLVLSKITAERPTELVRGTIIKKIFHLPCEYWHQSDAYCPLSTSFKLHPTCINEQPVVISFWKWKNGTRDYCWK